MGRQTGHGSLGSHIEVMRIFSLERKVQTFGDGTKRFRRNLEYHVARSLVHKLVVDLVLIVNLQARTELEG